MTITAAGLYRYPLKGLNAEPLERVVLSPGEGLPEDRRFALAHGSTRIDVHAPRWLPKTDFLMLMRDEKLAQLRARFAPDTGMLTITRAGKRVVHAKVTEPLGRTLIDQFFAAFLGASARGAPHLVEAPGHMFSDVDEKCLSLVNMASVHDLERVVRQPVDPHRFRANVHLEGAPAWAEFDWVGREISLGAARLRVRSRIERCGATNVDPETAARDMNIPRALRRGFGHIHMGVYAQVIGGGTIARGDRLVPPG